MVVAVVDPPPSPPPPRSPHVVLCYEKYEVMRAQLNGHVSVRRSVFQFQRLLCGGLGVVVGVGVSLRG